MLRARRPYLHSLLLLVFLFGLLPVPLAGPVNAHVGTPEPTVPVSAPDPVEEPPVEVEPAPEPTLAPEPTATATIAPTETPAPTPTPEPTATTAPTETPEPTPTQEAGIDLPTETPTSDATPTVAVTPTAEPTVAAPAQNTDTLTLTDPVDANEPLTLDENGSLTLSFDYAVTTDRESTMVDAQITGSDGAPVEGWTVSVNGTGDGEFTDTTHVTGGDIFPLEVAISGPIEASHTTVHLSVTSTVVVSVNAAGASEASSAVMHEQPGPTAEMALQNRDQDALIAPASVENEGRLTCDTANNGDVIAPGEIISFKCSITGLNLITNFTSVISVADEYYNNGLGWDISIRSPSLSLLIVDVIGNQTDWGQSHTISSTSVLGLGASVDFWVNLRAPLTPAVPGGTATVEISATSCLVGCWSIGSAGLTATLEMTHAASGGGALLRGGLLPGLNLGDALFDIQCGNVNADRTIAQGLSARATCTVRSTVGLDVLNAVTVDGSIRLSSTGGPFGYSIDSPDSHTCPGDILALCLGEITNASLIAGVTFDIVITPLCGTDPANAIQVVRLDASYGLSLLNGDPLPLTDGWATVPFTITEGAPAAPMISGVSSDVSFGSSRWNGTSYGPLESGDLNLTISPPGSGCMTPDFPVQISASSLTADGGVIPAGNMTITAVADISETPATWGDTTKPLFPLDSPQTIFTTNDNAPAATLYTSDPAELVVTLNLQPPDNVPPGTYTGTITITPQPAAPGD